jgi:hypothetical protein
MGAVIKGLGVLWGVQGLTFTGFGTATSKAQSLNLDRNAKLAEVADEQGDTVTQVFHDHKKRIQLKVCPTGTSVALAGAHLDLLIPQPGSTVTISDSTNATVDGHNSGKYNVMRAAFDKGNTIATMIDMELEQAEANDLTTAVS